MPSRRRGAFLQHPHEGRTGIRRSQRRPQGISIRAPGKPHINGGEDAPVHGSQMGREGDGDGRPRGIAQPLFDLGPVTVRRHPIGGETLGNLTEQVGILQRPSRPRNTGLGVDDDAFRVDQASTQKRRQGQQ